MPDGSGHTLRGEAEAGGAAPCKGQRYPEQQSQPGATRAQARWRQASLAECGPADHLPAHGRTRAHGAGSRSRPQHPRWSSWLTWAFRPTRLPSLGCWSGAVLPRPCPHLDVITQRWDTQPRTSRLLCRLRTEPPHRVEAHRPTLHRGSMRVDPGQEPRLGTVGPALGASGGQQAEARF